MPDQERHLRPPAVQVGQPGIALYDQVVAEPLCLLVGVDVAADVRQERGVVEHRPLLLIELEPVTEPQGNEALSKHVLHRLAEPEVGTERQDRHELGEPHAAPVEWTHERV